MSRLRWATVPSQILAATMPIVRTWSPCYFIRETMLIQCYLMLDSRSTQQEPSTIWIQIWVQLGDELSFLEEISVSCQANYRAISFSKINRYCTECLWRSASFPTRKSFFFKCGILRSTSSSKSPSAILD